MCESMYKFCVLFCALYLCILSAHSVYEFYVRILCVCKFYTFYIRILCAHLIRCDLTKFCSLGTPKHCLIL